VKEELRQQKPRNFLTADWKNIILCNFSVPDELLLPYLPAGAELDRWQGSAYLSFVAFQFLQTKVWGISWPGYSDFPEINLRFYVRFNGIRGVCFVREFVPSVLVAGLARIIYNEPYESAPMRMRVTSDLSIRVAQYSIFRAGNWNNVEVIAGIKPELPTEDSMAHFFKEHDLGVGRNHRQETTTYSVHHPFWEVFEVQKLALNLDWKTLYGPAFSMMQGKTPDSVIFAKGSTIEIPA
jgi:hypothetical protein